jgi:hypothetical protein
MWLENSQSGPERHADRVFQQYRWKVDSPSYLYLPKVTLKGPDPDDRQARTPCRSLRKLGACSDMVESLFLPSCPRLSLASTPLSQYLSRRLLAGANPAMPPGRCFNATGIRSKVRDSLAIPDILDWPASGTNSCCSANGSAASKALWAPAGRESGTGGRG